MTSMIYFWLFIGIWRSVWCFGNPTPVVIWHGSGDTSDGNPDSIGRLIEDNIEGVYVKRIRIGYTPWDEYQNSIYLHPDIQVSIACKSLKDDLQLSDGYNAIGLSQGGIFLRAVAQRCPEPPMKNLITLATPHQGVYGIPNCHSLQKRICDLIKHFLFLGAYKSSIQKQLVPATYWHDPFNESLYKWQSTFLSNINNEARKNEKYSRNLKRLERFVMVKFRNDSITQPRDTHWFEFYAPGQDTKIMPLRKSKLYVEDKLGLAQMDAEGKLIFLELDGEHLMYSDDWLVQNLLGFLKT